MSADEIRDDVAKLKGWIKRSMGWEKPPMRAIWPMSEHPCPATIDGAAAVMPKGWWWTKEAGDGDPLVWCAFKSGYSYVSVPDTGDELHDRYALARACLLAERGVDHG